jgi:hypothetical protein
MIVKPAIAALLASGLIMPEAPKLVLPKPAIVKAENLEFSKHMLLGMPLTMGMLPGKAGDPFFIDSSQYSTSASSSLETITWTHTTTAATTCLVVAGTAVNNAGNTDITSVTFNGVSLTQIVSAGSGNSTSLWRLFSPAVGSFTLSVTMSGTNDRFISGHAVNLGNANAVNTSNADEGSAQTFSVSLTTTKKTIIVASSFVASSTSTARTITYSSPSTTTTQQSANNSSNSIGKTANIATSTLQNAASLTVTSVSSGGTNTHRLAAAAFAFN